MQENHLVEKYSIKYNVKSFKEALAKLDIFFMNIPNIQFNLNGIKINGKKEELNEEILKIKLSKREFKNEVENFFKELSEKEFLEIQKIEFNTNIFSIIFKFVKKEENFENYENYEKYFNRSNTLKEIEKIAKI